ncbi:MULTISPECIES: DUF2523 family protein [Aeromonas]|uniref:DUF2523 domain-containing protein n=1 Tax=Aeromonas encheleia TaxID=73010 RepID=A0AAE9MKG9_9GAMM|nr:MULTISPECIES: DUF2523 family protein [Aeromonas]MBV7597899.1 DUF2523 domain-containing protein [Aeromonas sp. sia0103]USV59382.1 DUF2523 domain-containing protein [Aeromonas encheleia]
MEWLGDLFNGLFNDIYNLAVQVTAWIVVKMAIQWVEFKLFMLMFSWDVAREILINLQFSDLISTSFNNLPESVRDILLYLHFDKGLSVMTQAFVTRFMLNIFGW